MCYINVWCSFGDSIHASLSYTLCNYLVMMHMLARRTLMLLLIITGLAVIRARWLRALTPTGVSNERR